MLLRTTQCRYTLARKTWPPAPSSIRTSFRASPFSTSPTSKLEELFDSLDAHKQSKWGYIFYRCTYTSEPAWQNFKHIIENQASSLAAHEDFPEILETLDHILISNKSLFDGATRDTLRKYFKAWRDEAVVKEQPNVHLSNLGTDDIFRGNPRYHLFLQVDEESLQSVISDPEVLNPDSRSYMRASGHLNLIDANWRPTTEADIRETKCQRLYLRYA